MEGRIPSETPSLLQDVDSVLFSCSSSVVLEVLYLYIFICYAGNLFSKVTEEELASNIEVPPVYRIVYLFGFLFVYFTKLFFYNQKMC